MDIVKGDLLTIEDLKYITLEILNYEGNNYAFVNKITDSEEVTEEFYIFKLLGDKISVVTEDNLMNILIPKFQELLQKDIIELVQDK